MDRQSHDYSSTAAMAFAQQQQQFGYHQHQQFPPSLHAPPFLPHTQIPPLQHYPFHHPIQQQQQQQYPHLHHHHIHPPPAFPPHLSPHLLPSPFASAPPPPAPPPSDPELHKRIDKLVEYAAKNGPEFEAMIREKQQDNPAYSFLFGGEGNNYYCYKLWLSTRPPAPGVPPGVPPFNNVPFPSSSLPMMHPPNPPPIITPSPLNTPPFPFFDHHHQHPQPFVDHGRSHSLDNCGRTFKGLSGPLPSDVALELSNVLVSLTGTKESIKGAKMWFMQRSPFAPALAEAIRERFCSLDDSERQLHMIYFANDILFDSLQRRVNPRELDNEALAFKPVLGCMLARIFHNPQNRDENQSRLQKILQFWASKEVYDHDTIRSFESEMIAAFPPDSSFPRPLLMDLPPPPPLSGGDPSTIPGGVSANQNVTWQSDAVPDEDRGPDPIQQSGLKPETEGGSGGWVPPYPLFPPGLIPGMVRKMQIGSGVPYSPMSPLDIPTLIPPSNISPSRLLQTVSKFFHDIGEPNPDPDNSNMKSEEDDDDDGSERGRAGLLEPARKGGACIPPPPNLSCAVDPDAEMGGSSEVGRDGVGAVWIEGSQYDDVYCSYRKQRSTDYHSSMSTRASSAAAAAALNLEIR